MLTDLEIRKAKPRDKAYKLADSGGLYLFVTPSGHRSWRLKYRFAGKEKALVLGTYPQLSLAEARLRREAAKKQLREHIDPGVEAKVAKLVAATGHEQTFEAVARDWYATQLDRWKPVHARDVITSLERDVFPHIGKLPMARVDEQVVLAVLAKVEKRGAIETARRLLQRIRAVSSYARGRGMVSQPLSADLVRSLKPVPRAKLRPALTSADKLRRLIADVDQAGAHPVTKLASRFMALTAQRPGMIRTAPWSEFFNMDGFARDDRFDGPIWIIPADRMKQDADLRGDESFAHRVPLSPHAVEVLQAVRQLTGRGPLPFCSNRSSHVPMSENAVGYLYNRLGYQGLHVPHGWRAAFATYWNERISALPIDEVGRQTERMVVDLMLAHIPQGLSPSELRYNRAAYMPRRLELATEWAEHLMKGQKSAFDLLTGPRR
ncbi:integrase arm-type DNA-binding domain-containing protein [Sphingomonas changnyeongensis]|uniref:Integrase arm-type DNA-binding domain-containing protein n=1 Tax=Sphingomonas changnyeongensis TaxID=2698679 RepID=A0A7Z2S6L7_9SPHN|nr:integrase arm-type DNA-binding domain-containing protein [Sphingomonas changnyeongensis]QHL91648.1 integrase arm-type DNA-binding domain-containing protein [Sphingomonas changnyeongensis]